MPEVISVVRFCGRRKSAFIPHLGDSSKVKRLFRCCNSFRLVLRDYPLGGRVAYEHILLGEAG